jgi:hypothetical protein
MRDRNRRVNAAPRCVPQRAHRQRHERVRGPIIAAVATSRVNLTAETAVTRSCSRGAPASDTGSSGRASTTAAVPVNSAQSGHPFSPHRRHGACTRARRSDRPGGSAPSASTGCEPLSQAAMICAPTLSCCRFEPALNRQSFRLASGVHTRTAAASTVIAETGFEESVCKSPPESDTADRPRRDKRLNSNGPHRGQGAKAV